MDYDRERRISEARAKEAVAAADWPLVAYYLFHAARVTNRMAARAEGPTRRSLIQVAKRYEARGDKAFAKAGTKEEHDGRVRIPREDSGAVSEREEAWVLPERPDLRLSDVAGMEAVKEVIESHVVLPMRHADIYAQYRVQPGSGVLLYGPPGTGKTFVARAIAGEVDAAFIAVEMRKVLSKWFGETEQLLADLFEAARSHPRSVIFFDEAEALFPKRGATNSSVMARVVPQLLQLLNGIDPEKNCVVLLGATNRPWLMDEAATRPGRFGRLLYVGPPDPEARTFLVQRAMADTPTAGLDYGVLAARSEGYSGADLAGERDSVCIEAKMIALKRTVKKTAAALDDEEIDPEPVTMDDFDEAFRRVKPSITPDGLKRYEQFSKRCDG